MVPAVSGGHRDPRVDMAFLQAHHRYMEDFCGRYPDRLKTIFVATARDIPGSVEQIRRWGKARWAAAFQVQLPLDYPLDHPDLNPIWEAAQEHDLCFVHHSFSAGYPGYRDLWDNPFLGRTAGHPWAAMRAVGAIFGSGLMDRYPSLRVSVLESGFGWLPSWGARMDDQVEYMGYVSESMRRRPTEYMTGGRFFCGIVLHEGEDMVRLVTELLGDHVLMFGSDYHHAESRFPNSVDLVQGWKSLKGLLAQKLLWDNAVRAYGEP
jgi:predicted TIM-barrel fold metal-dependent hydrolase